MWLELNREGLPVASWTIERLMRADGLVGATAGDKRTQPAINGGWESDNEACGITGDSPRLPESFRAGREAQFGCAGRSSFESRSAPADPWLRPRSSADERLLSQLALMPTVL
ncbi:MAG: hypothetical protein ACYC1E_16415 [Propionibacteriaceae bacterium]